MHCFITHRPLIYENYSFWERIVFPKCRRVTYVCKLWLGQIWNRGLKLLNVLPPKLKWSLRFCDARQHWRHCCTHFHRWNKVLGSWIYISDCWRSFPLKCHEEQFGWDRVNIYDIALRNILHVTNWGVYVAIADEFPPDTDFEFKCQNNVCISLKMFLLQGYSINLF